MDLTANWIWRSVDGQSYNDVVVTRRSVQINGDLNHALVSITADSYYRLIVNGKWVCDGPARGWPEHYYYDRVDITDYLKQGDNEVRIIACYYGVGHFHGIPQRPGILAQIDLQYSDASNERIVTDSGWQIAKSNAWHSNTPKISCQMSPNEFYLASNEDDLSFEDAVVICGANEGPWKDLQFRDVKMLTKKPVSFTQFVKANLLKKYNTKTYCFPWTKLLYPGLIQANRLIVPAFGLATVVEADSEITFTIAVTDHRKGDYNISIDGSLITTPQMKVKAGQHLLFISSGLSLNHMTDITVCLDSENEYRLSNPYMPNSDNSWTMLGFEEFKCADTDLQCQRYTDKFQFCLDGYMANVKSLHQISNIEEFVNQTARHALHLPFDEMFAEDRYCRFLNRQEATGANVEIKSPKSIIESKGGPVTISPSENGDAELIYDLGTQNIGYFSFDLESERGVEVDVYAVEYITPNGKIQFTEDHRNGMSYVTKEGLNVFTSLKRRSGRYVFIRFNNQTKPIKLNRFELIESTYPTNFIGSFECSDLTLNKIWNISAHTLKLCMEDTFTDCPLYEQTLWVGDARNESLFAYGVFGSTDIAKRCIKLAAQSLERFDMVGSQVPSSWFCILPAWSFLWGISIWDYYWYTGDKDFLKQIWPEVYKNLKGAAKYIEANGLFTADFWNFFDWAGIDQDHPTVLHNSMFMIGAIDAAVKCRRVLGDDGSIEELAKLRRILKDGVSNLWNENKQAYPDSIHKDGTVSESVCQHTSFLSLLYDIVEDDKIEALMQNVIETSDDTVKVGSPFAMLYLYETLEKYGRNDLVIKSIYDSYAPMLNAGAVTVWESFNTGTLSNDEFPTRSHCHGWSSAPLYFLPRIILGIKQTSPGCKSFKINPYTKDLDWARGTFATPNGQIEVKWQKEKDKLNIYYKTPTGIETVLEENVSYNDLSIFYHLMK